MTSPAVSDGPVALTPIKAVPDQDRRRPAADARLRAAGAVLAGEPLSAVAERHGVDVEQVLRWTDGLCAGGASGVGGVGVDRPARGPHATSVPVEDYLQVIAHELRTPLTAARTGLRVLGREDLPSQVRAQVCSTVLERLVALDQLAQDVLDAVGIAAGRIQLAPERVDLGLALREACSTYGIAYGSEPAVPVTVDPQRLRQVLGALLRHALRYVAPGAVTTQIARLQDAVLLTVRLGGLWLAPDQAHAHLEPFAVASRGDGNGLALYVVRTLVVASGGQVGLAGQGEPGDPDAATVLWLRLPAAP